MNILLLTKTKSHLSLNLNSIEESVLEADNFFGGYYRAFVKLGHEVSVSTLESTVVSSKFKINCHAVTPGPFQICMSVSGDKKFQHASKPGILCSKSVSINFASFKF